MSFAEPHPVSRYNQMLVVSVFIHCLILGTIMFMPKTTWKNNVIKPAFRVQLMTLPGSKSSQQAPMKPVETKVEQVKKKPPAPTVQKKVNKPVKKAAAAKPIKKTAVTKPEKVRKPTPVKKPPVKPAAAPKKTPVRPVKTTMAKPTPTPPKVAVPPSSKNLFQELDQVAALPKKMKTPVQPKKTDTFLEDQVRELEALKASSVPGKVTRKTPLALEPPTLERIPTAAASIQAEKHKKFEQLLATEAEASPAAKRGKTSSRPQLMDDLESISQLHSKRTVVPNAATLPTSLPGKVSTAHSKEIESLKQELASLKQGDIKVDIKVEPPQSTKSPSTFKSRMHKLSAPDPTKNYVVATLPQKLTQPKGGSPEADRLSEYVATIQEIVYSNWKSPVGAEHNQVRASFVVFPAGKIDRPSLVQSSGNEVLDNLALRAISASEPFPPFPKELKEPNLHIVVHFRYVYQE